MLRTDKKNGRPLDSPEEERFHHAERAEGDRIDQSRDDDLTQVWPPFLEDLADDSNGAFDQFYRFAVRVFHKHPPRMMRRLSPEDREDAVHTVVFHCCDQQFRVLRKYRPQGRPFAQWLRRVADRKILDGLEKEAREPNGPAPDPDTPADSISPEIRLDMKRARTATLKSMRDLDLESQILLAASAMGMTPLEMTRLLGLPKNHNIKLSEKCRYQRNKLKGMLRKQGIDIAELLSGKKRTKDEHECL